MVFIVVWWKFLGYLWEIKIKNMNIDENLKIDIYCVINIFCVVYMLFWVSYLILFFLVF